MARRTSLTLETFFAICNYPFLFLFFKHQTSSVRALPGTGYESCAFCFFVLFKKVEIYEYFWQKATFPGFVGRFVFVHVLGIQPNAVVRGVTHGYIWFIHLIAFCYYVLFFFVCEWFLCCCRLLIVVVIWGFMCVCVCVCVCLCFIVQTSTCQYIYKLYPARHILYLCISISPHCMFMVLSFLRVVFFLRTLFPLWRCGSTCLNTTPGQVILWNVNAAPFLSHMLRMWNQKNSARDCSYCTLTLVRA